jgi:hypothetical protein
LNDNIIELFKVEGVRSGFYVANFGYFLKSNLRNLGKNGFSVFFFSFQQTFATFVKLKIAGKIGPGGL